ncbi:outer membrane beta-barrel protein [bacterium]|nr:outer membrane beta-barrel protein [bacterium]
MKYQKTITGTIVILLLLASSLFSQQPKIGLMGGGGMVGYIDPEGEIESTFAYGARVDLGTVFHPNLGFMTEFLYWSKDYDVDVMGVSWSWSYAQTYVAALAKYTFGETGTRSGPYAGGGLGMVQSKVKNKYTDPILGNVDVSESETDLCIHILGGFSYLISPKISSFGEFRLTLDGANFWGIFAGFTYNLR